MAKEVKARAKFTALAQAIIAADESDRLDYTVTSANIGMVAIQTDTSPPTVWILASVSPSVAWAQVDATAVSLTLEEVLTEGNETGSNDIIVDDGQAVRGAPNGTLLLAATPRADGVGEFTQATLQGADSTPGSGANGGPVLVRGGNGGDSAGGADATLKGGDGANETGGNAVVQGGAGSGGKDGGNVELIPGNGATFINAAGEFRQSAGDVGFYGATPVPQSAAYTPTNVTPDRSYDADATTVAELADVLGTLIADLQALGLIG